MLIRVRKDQTLALEEEDDFEGFCIRVKDSGMNLVALDMITKRKNKMVQELETLLYNQFKRILFERLRDPEDHRQAIYKLKEGKSIVCYTTE